MKVVKLTTSLEKKYCDFLDKNPNSMLYHTLKYKKLLESFISCNSDYLICIDEYENVTGVLPVMSKNGIYGKVYNALPFYGANGSILFENIEVRKSIIEAYNHLVVDSLSATLITSPFDAQPEPNDLKYDLKDYRIGQITFFPVNANDLMSLFHYKTRNMVRKAQKNNIVIKIENTSDALEYLYSTHVENLEEIGGKVKTKYFFDSFQVHFEAGKDFNIYVAYINGIRIAALLLFYHKKIVEYYTPVISQNYRELQPLSLLIFEAMQDAVQNGFTSWNWGGTWGSQDGVYRFKQRWGTTDINYYYYSQINNESAYYVSKEKLLNEYEYFFVLPFQSLKPKLQS